MISIHSLSELERLKLQETAYHELVARHFLSEFKPERALPIDRPNTLEKWFLILRGQERAVSLKTFGIRLEEVLVNELTRRKQLELRAAMQMQEATGHVAGRRRGNVVQRMFGRIRRFFSRRRAEPSLPREFTRRGRRGAVSVDSLAELEDGALLLQTLQLSKTSFPIGQRLLGSKRKMSLNPIAKQTPQVVEACCSFIEKHGLSTVGIFTLEYSEQRVRKLREEFDQGLDVVLDGSQNVHDVAALLKEFFRDMKDSLLPDDLYMSFLLTATLKPQDQLSALQLLVYLMPPCHSDTLERLLKVLHKITENCEDSIGIDGQLVSGNRMTSTNLALVFGSALLKRGTSAKRESRKTRLGIDHYVASVNVVRAMIDNWDILFQVPPHIQRQVAKRVWKSSPEALDFIRRRNLRKIQSARIKMEEDALLSDPVENSAEARAAVLGQSKPFDEGQFPAGGQTPGEGQSLGEGQAPPEVQVLAEDEPLEEDESSEEDVPVNEELVFEYLNQGVDFEVQGLEIPNDLEIPGPHLEGIPELDEDYDSLNFDDLPPLEDILDSDDEILELIEIQDFEEIPYFDMVPDPEVAQDVQEIPNPGENSNHNLEEGLDFEDYQNLDLAEVPYLDVIPNNEEASDTDEIPDNEEAPDTDGIPDHADDSGNDENSDSEEDPDLEEVPALDETPNDEASNAEEVPDHEVVPEVNGISDSNENFDFDEVPALHVVPSPEEAPGGHEIPNHEESPEVNGLSDSEEDPSLEEVPALDGVPNDEETSDTEEIPDYEETPEVNGIAGSEDSNPEETPALHVVTSPEDVSDFDEIQNQEESSDVSGVPNNEEASYAEEIPGHKEDADVSGIQDSEENPNLKEDTVLSVIPETGGTQIHNKIPDSQKDLANTFEEDEITNMAPGPEDVSILNTIPEPQPDLAVNLEEIMNVEAVPMPTNLDSKEVQSPKTIQFRIEYATVTFPVDTAFLKNRSQPGQVMDYRSSSESLKTDTCFLPSMKFCSSEEPAVPPGTARSHDDDEGAGNPPILEQDRPLLRVPREKEAQTGIGYFFP
ncbi:rho GTPase-activating protein 36 isoform X1 [Kogia breviceps]|uniref:rho GTPase-activating protein 36 isoform X1 n=1 Tax=Kogia breviceps TaxID=27615 RepID=UPI002795771D|nr:rho GTPase-activating protein 36 isoform X1 [Kogia breviceps]XP_058906912.1 rho GTPase-activating protein 36 isoform X1 [Kogia breviceps]XP_058906913.1 rho GTPase-activating protein 36 isoform X1 [Kogia breviceps]XP_058906914.1 rho GTPase-activating protein 36 isoform X1 [Kogia breviceps]XP_058906915.1 rho GTPase-activating protein 36 isoform X1 [Kogia breviceps]XP_058906916.1 rho GTPase-activating protein 36 isoform X1 [Kogia breviceps]XP_058906917.1 rho GTPase-activating protein 36 isofo